jgi:hypothetical protein
MGHRPFMSLLLMGLGSGLSLDLDLGRVLLLGLRRGQDSSQWIIACPWSRHRAAILQVLMVGMGFRLLWECRSRFRSSSSSSLIGIGNAVFSRFIWVAAKANHRSWRRIIPNEINRLFFEHYGFQSYGLLGLITITLFDLESESLRLSDYFWHIHSTRKGDSLASR